MQDMSDLRKSIADRLGSAGKVKSARIDSSMLDGSMREVPIILKDGSHAVARKSASGWKVDGHADIPAFAKLRDLVAHMDKMGFSRPGAKAKMAKYRAFVYRGSPRSNVLVKATEWMDSASAAEEAAKQIAMSFRGQPGYNSDNYFADIAQETPMGAKTVKNNVLFSRPGAKAQFAGPTGRPIRGLQIPDGYFGVYERSNRPGQDAYSMWVTLTNGQSISLGSHPSLNGAMKIGQMLASGERKVKDYAFSRPGAKAKFAEDAREVAQEILRQLGGGRFMAMVGGKNAFHGTFGGKTGLQIDIGKGAEGGINRLIVKLDRGSDTYDMEFWRVAKRGMDVKKVSEASGVYADDLQRIFTSRTKFYTSLSRPGAKAKMGREYSGNSKRLNNGTVVAAWDNGDAAHFANATQAQSFSDKHGLGGVYQSPSSRTFFVLVAKATASRPGAKAKFMTNAGFAFLQKMLREYASMKGTRWYNEAEEIRDNSTEYTDADVIAAVGNLKAKSVSSRPGAKGSSKAKA